MNLSSQLESILFVASKPLSMKQLEKATGADAAAVAQAIEDIALRMNHEASGLRLIQSDDTVQLATAPEHAELVDGFIKRDIQGELTRAQLETLTVIAYRGPVTRPEIEHIRGVNCAVILRNLLLRGLIQESQEKDALLARYSVSVDMLAHLGLTGAGELPDFDSLSRHAHIEAALQETQEPQTT